MKKRTGFYVSLVLIAALLLILVSGCGAQPAPKQEAPAGPQPVHIKFSSHNLGSAWYSYAASIAEILRPLLPKDSTIDVLPYGGGFSGMPLISKGDADIGLGSTSPNAWARKGTVVFTEKYENLRALVGGFDEYFITIVLPKKLNITSVEQLMQTKGLTWMTLPTGSLGKLGAEHLLEFYGSSWDKIKADGGKVEHTDFDTIKQAFKDNRGDVFIHVMTQGHPTLMEMTTTQDLVILPIPEDARQKMGSEYGWLLNTMPANSFRGQTADVPSFGVCTGLSTTDKLPDDLAYLITKAVIENADKLIKSHAGLKYFDINKAGLEEVSGMPLHPGALKYYKEKGLVK